MHPIVYTVFHRILNAIGDICDRTCHKVLFSGANKFPLFDLSQNMCTKYHDI